MAFSQVHYDSFHVLVELFDVTVAGCVFLIVWSVRRIELPTFFLIIGIGQGFVGLLGLLHLVLAVPPETATLLKNSSRLIDATALLAGCLLYSASIPYYAVFAGYFMLTGLLAAITAAVSAGGGPALAGLTWSVPAAALLAYVIGGILLQKRRGSFSRHVFRCLMASYGLNFAAVVLIMTRTRADDPVSIAGHLLSLAAYLLLAKALIRITFQEPTDTLLRQLYERDQDRKALMERLSAEKERYRAIIAQSHEALAIIDGRTGHILEINRPMTELTGYSMDMVRGRNSFEIIDMSQEEINASLATLREKGVLLPAIRRIRHADGHLLRLERMVSCIESGADFLFVYSLRNLSDERRRQETITAEVDYAGFLQRAMQPAGFFANELEVRTLWEPLHGVSGDAISFKWLPEQKRLIGYLMDVTGHGLATALQTSALKALIDIELTGGLRPQSEILRRLNSDAAAYFHEGSFAAVLLFEFDLRYGLLRCSGAGIYEFLACSGGHNGILQLPGSFLGIMREAEFGYLELPLARGNKFYFFTDGLTDLLAQQKPVLSPEDFGVTCDFLKKLAQSRERRDDSAGIFVHVKDIDEPQLRLPMPAPPDLPHQFAQLHEQILRLNEQRDLSDSLHFAMMSVMHMIEGATIGQIQVYNAMNDVMETRVAVGALQKVLFVQYRKGEYLVGKVWESARTVLINDYRHWPGRRQGEAFDQIRCVVGIPLIASGTVIGVLSVGFDQPNRYFLAEQLSRLEMFCSVVSLIVEQRLLLEAQEQEFLLFRRSSILRTIAPCFDPQRRNQVESVTKRLVAADHQDWLAVKLTLLMHSCPGDPAGYIRISEEQGGRYVRGLLLGAAASVIIAMEDMTECPSNIARLAINIWEGLDFQSSLREQLLAIHRGLCQRSDGVAAIPTLLFCLDRQEKKLHYASGGVKLYLAITRTLHGIQSLHGNSPGSSALPMLLEHSVLLQAGDEVAFQPGTALRLVMESKDKDLADFARLKQQLSDALERIPHGAGTILLEVDDAVTGPILFDFIRLQQWDVIRKRLRRHLLSHIGDAAIKMEIALGEAVSNALRFGPELGNPLVQLCLKRYATTSGLRYVVIRVRHFGRPFDGNGYLARLALQGEDYFRDILEQDSGRGLALMKVAADRVVYSASGQEVLLFKRMTGPRGDKQPIDKK